MSEPTVEGLPDPLEPDGGASTEQVEYGEASHSVLTPEGQIESYGNFARGLGPRVVKGAIFGGGLLLVVLAVLAVLAEVAR